MTAEPIEERGGAADGLAWIRRLMPKPSAGAEQGRTQQNPGADPMLQWLIFTGLSLFALVLLVYSGHLQRMISSDRTMISPAIALLYIATSGHCFWRTLAISREIGAAAETARAIAANERWTAGAGSGGMIAAHIRDLAVKARLQAKGRLDQTLLLRTLASRLRGSSPYGAFMGDAMMKLGLLGTVIGFIMMLAPIAGLDVENQGAVKSSMALMSDGMAVAMYTTLAGLSGALLLKIQYSIVEHATAKLFAFAVELTEVHVVPVLERGMGAEE